MSDKKPLDAELVEDHMPLKEELDELKREMRSAQWADWMQKNQKLLLVITASVLVALMIAGFMIEQNRAQRADAATIYEQAITASDDQSRTTLLEQVRSDYGSSTYGALAAMQLASSDREHAEQHLKAVISHPKSMQEWIWQARLDLAALKLEAGDAAAAKGYLEEHVGKQYQQLRHYLLALTSADQAEKRQHLQQAVDAESHDEALKSKIEALLAQAS